MLLSEHIDYVQSRINDGAQVISRAEILKHLIDGLRMLFAKSGYNRTIWVENLPPRYAGAVTQQWEKGETRDNLRKFTFTHASGLRECTFLWEVEAGATDPLPSVGMVSQLWELEYTQPTEAHYRVALPRGSQEIKAMWFDHKRLAPIGVLQMDEIEDSWWQVSGEPIVFITGLSNSREFDLYEITTTDSAGYEIETHTAGIFRQISGAREYEVSSPDSGDYAAAGVVRGFSSPDRQYFASCDATPTGMMRDARSTEDNLLIIYTELPTAENMTEDAELGMIDARLQKYMRYYALYAIFNHPGELYEPNIAAHYEARYQRGIRLLSRLARVLNRDEHYMREAGYRSATRRRPGRPRLPSNYPRPY